MIGALDRLEWEGDGGGGGGRKDLEFSSSTSYLLVMGNSPSRIKMVPDLQP